MENVAAVLFVVVKKSMMKYLNYDGKVLLFYEVFESAVLILELENLILAVTLCDANVVQVKPNTKLNQAECEML